MMQSSGWIKLHRNIMTKALWQAMPTEQSVVAIVLLLMVSHKDKNWLWKGEKYQLAPGQIITSLDGIINNCPKNVSKQNVRTALKNLQKLEFLTDKSICGGRLITILNWAIYQGDEEKLTAQLTGDQQITNRQLTGDQQITNRQLTDDQQITNTNQEVKNLSIKKYKTLPYKIPQGKIYENVTVANGVNSARDNDELFLSTLIQKRFEEFWTIYPKKVDKGTARKIYTNLKPTIELHIKIISAVERCKKSEQWQKWDGQFIPHPSTWLNGERWEDEPISPKKQKINRNRGISKMSNADIEAIIQGQNEDIYNN